MKLKTRLNLKTIKLIRDVIKDATGTPFAITPRVALLVIWNVLHKHRPLSKKEIKHGKKLKGIRN